MRPILQVALDEVELERAVAIAVEAVAGGADYIEAGTPLIKSEGMNAVRTLRENFRDHVIVADMKTMDTGAIEVEMAIKSGAGIVSILGACDDSTVEDAVRSARKYGGKLMADLINVGDAVSRAVRLQELGVDIICVHVGVDQQMVGKDPLDILKEVRSAVSIEVAVAGGLNPESAASAVALGAGIVIVGGNIIRARDVTASARRVRESIDAAGKQYIVSEKKARDEEIRELFMQVSTPNISDAMHRAPAMRDIKPLYEGIKMVGRAVTVQNFPGDWAKPVEASDVAQKGEVIVIYNGSNYIAPWGELASRGCQQKGIAGVVIDGAIRDVDDIKRIKFPAFASASVPNAGDPKGMGEINVEITCGGLKVRPGDWIIGDDNGVMVVPAERAYEVARRALEVKKSEDRVRAEIERGKTLAQVMDLYKWEKK
ncbi:3-hexulose-6-phosphate synthase [Methanocella conradii HZ254]|uniref:3-hexulose-6-phosphate synthase n=1 Tax=Methanocella conradii (strain DSM 24694 / JCM 17849 / CGMCC 1.5162 / HZ254) TaxID=1041930 RepID=H8I4I6_METCZ|nr:3-hexulose-6-phosphate synthase [Methanocella conradii]AFD00165.1 3-hexulose-6-phosphate synthase [Methanocella conradii HZ254]